VPLRNRSSGTELTRSDDDEFNDRIVNDLTRRLDGPVRLPLSTHEKALLITVIEGTHEVGLTVTF